MMPLHLLHSSEVEIPGFQLQPPSLFLFFSEYLEIRYKGRYFYKRTFTQVHVELFQFYSVNYYGCFHALDHFNNRNTSTVHCTAQDLVA